jgi:hypothetical protein
MVGAALGGCAGSGRSWAASGLGRAAAHACRPAAPGDPLGVEVLEQRLGVAARGSELVAQARERDAPSAATIARTRRTRRRSRRDGRTSPGRRGPPGRRRAAPPAPRRVAPRSSARGGSWPAARRRSSSASAASDSTGASGGALGGGRRPASAAARRGSGSPRPQPLEARDAPRAPPVAVGVGVEHVPPPSVSGGEAARTTTRSPAAASRSSSRRSCHRPPPSRPAGRQPRGAVVDVHPRAVARAVRGRAPRRAARRPQRASGAAARRRGRPPSAPADEVDGDPPARPARVDVSASWTCTPRTRARASEGRTTSRSPAPIAARPQRPGDDGARAADRERAVDVQDAAPGRAARGASRRDPLQRGGDLGDARARARRAGDELELPHRHQRAPPRAPGRGRRGPPS